MVLVAVVLVAFAPTAWAGDVPRPVAAFPQEIPTALERVFATDNAKLDIDGVDDKRVDVDVAILDTGIDLENPDLNVVEGTDCTGASWPFTGPSFGCSSASSTAGMDSDAGIWHGTKSAIAIAALDNDIGEVGIAAGARLWSVKVHDDDVYDGSNNPARPIVFDLESVIAGVKWVTAHADEIEVAHIPVACAPEQTDPGPQPRCAPGPQGVNVVDELEDAIEESIAAGVVYVFGSGNWNQDVSTVVPQRFDNMLIAGQMVDTDGQPGALGPNATDCGDTPDDHKSAISNWGAGVDIAAPGCPASHASPHVTAAAAVLASKSSPDSLIGVQAIHAQIINAGNTNWVNTFPNGTPERLLDVSNQELFDPKPVIPPGVGVVSPKYGVVDLYMRADNGDVTQRVWNHDTGWSGWIPQGSPPGGATSEPTAVARPYGPANVRDIFVRGANGALWQKTWTQASGSWTNWTQRGDPGLGSGPAAVSPVSDQVHVFARDTEQVLYEKVWTAGSGWSNWSPMSDGANITGVGVVSPKEGVIDLYARDENGNIKQRVWNQGFGWTGWFHHGSPPGGATSEPSVAARPYGSANVRDVFVRGANGALWQKTWTQASGAWTDWVQLGLPGMISAPAAVSPLADTMHTFTRASFDDLLYRRIWTIGAGWTTWQPVG